MASSSQIPRLFSFDALRDFGSRLFRDRPNRSPKALRAIAAVITVLQFPRMGELAEISTAGSRSWLARLCLGLACSTFLGAEGDRDRYVLETGSSMPPRSTCAAPRHVARLGDSALVSRASAGMLGRNETQIGHELPRIGETGDASPSSATSVAAATSARPRSGYCSAFTHWRQRPVRGKRGFDVRLQDDPAEAVAASTAAMQSSSTM